MKTYTTPVEISFNNINGYWSYVNGYGSHTRVYDLTVTILTIEDEPEYFLLTDKIELILPRT